MKILHPMTLITREEHYDNKTSLRYLFTRVVSMAGVSALPSPHSPITTPLVEAMHFRRGFHYTRVGKVTSWILRQ